MADRKTDHVQEDHECTSLVRNAECGKTVDLPGIFHLTTAEGHGIFITLIFYLDEAEAPASHLTDKRVGWLPNSYGIDTCGFNVGTCCSHFSFLMGVSNYQQGSFDQ